MNLKSRILTTFLIAMAMVAVAGTSFAAEKTIRIIHGEQRLTVDEVIRLDVYRLNRAQFIQEMKWENKDVERIRALQDLAMADIQNEVDEIERIFAKLQAEHGHFKRGKVSDFRTLKNLEIALGQRLDSLDIIKEAYAEVETIVSGEIAKVEGIAQKIGQMRFNVRKSEGWIKRDVTFAEIKADNTVSFETLLQEARQINLAELEGPGPVRNAVVVFNQKVFILMQQHLKDFDEWSDRSSFDQSSGNIAKKQIEEGLKLMSFLRARFGLKQVMPVIKNRGKIMGSYTIDAYSNNYVYNGDLTWLEYRLEDSSQAPEWLREIERAMEDLTERPATWFPKRTAIRKWFLERLFVQMKAEVALRTEGREASGARENAPSDNEVKAVLNRVPTNEIVGAFKEVLFAINAASAHRNLEKPAKGEGLANWDDLLGGESQ